MLVPPIFSQQLRVKFVMIFFPMTRVTIVFFVFFFMRFVFFGADEVTDLFSKWRRPPNSTQASLAFSARRYNRAVC